MPPTMTVGQSRPAVFDALSSLRGTAKALGVLFGVGVVCAAFIGALLAVVMLDRVFRLPAIPRVGLVVIALAGAGYLSWRYILRAALARLSISDVASRVENVFPHFEDRLRSTVDFVQHEVPGSEFMKQKVVSDADSLARNVDLRQTLVLRPVIMSLGAGILALLLVGVLMIAFPNSRKIALNRLIGGNADWPRRQEIQIDGIREKVAADQKLQLKVRLTKGDNAGIKATVFVKTESGQIFRQIMTRDKEGTYSAAVDARGPKMTVWVEAGDNQTAPQVVTVVEPLRIRNVSAVVAPPAYVKTGPANYNLSQAPATVVRGSTVSLRVEFNKPLAALVPVELELVKAAPKEGEAASAAPAGALTGLKWDPAPENQAQPRFEALNSVRFRVKAQDIDGLRNAALEEYEIVVRPDQFPTVIIESPRRDEERTATAFVNLEILAKDDFDIATMTLMVQRVGVQQADQQAKPHSWSIPLTGWTASASAGERRDFRLAYKWELGQLDKADLKPGDVLQYFVRVTDNYDYNGTKNPHADSGKLKIVIISQETLNTQVMEELKNVADQVRVAKARQDTVKAETKALTDNNKEKKQMDPADRAALSRISDQQSKIASQTKQIAGRVSETERRLEENRAENNELKDIAKDVKNTLNDTAENPMSQASRELGKASEKSDPKQSQDQKGNPDPQRQQQNASDRQSAMQNAQSKQQQSSEQLDKALAKMNNLGNFENMIQKVREALKNQQDLSEQLKDLGKETIGKKENELTKEQKQKLDDIAKKQGDQSKKTDDLTKALDKAAQQSQKSDPTGSQAMQQAAKTSQQQQVSQSQSQAAQQAQQNQQAQAQAKQKQAELGLQMMLDQMREAERRKLEKLTAELQKLQELIANLIRRQAGHNIDNLRIQDTPAVLKLISDELLAKAERVKDKQPAKPDGNGLGNSQTTTERNTRDTVKVAEDLPKGGAEISGLLTDAARRMESAIISIRDVKLPEAYDPSQVKALVALEEAKKKTDEALAEAKEQQENADRETLRQAYEKIRDDQVKVNDETARIDKSPRLPDGTYKREDSVSLAKLPGTQGQLSDRTKKLEEDLSALGGIVYVWANQDIVKSMNEVKKDLAKPTTAKPTRAEQARVVEQLTAMIDSLKTKPKKSEFENPGGGGGQGGGQPPKPKLPSEAELRLLKALQQAINRSTNVINSDPADRKDKPKLVGLGGRQGELRNLLDQLLQKASEGQVKLDPEPDPKNTKELPEEKATVDQIEDQEFKDWLKGAKPGDDQMADDVKMAGQRMARSKQRLGLDHDPGTTTQKIQDRIIANLDHLIEQARQQQAQASSKPGKGQPGKKPEPGDGKEGQQETGNQPGKQSQPNRGSQAAQNERGGGTQDNTANLSKEIMEKASEWGKLTPRERDAIIEGASDKVIEKYQNFTRKYYEALGKKATE